MALALRLDYLVKNGQVTDQAELARGGHGSRARLTQIMDLDLNLRAPDIQKKILFFTRHDIRLIAGPNLRNIAKIADQAVQRNRFQNLS